VNEWHVALYKIMRHVVVVNNLPLHYLDKPENKVFSKHEDAWVSSKTMRKYLQFMAQIVKAKIAARLPDQFAVYFDGWTNRKYHYLGVVASFIDRGVPEQRLLSLSPILNVAPGATDDTPDDEFITLFSPESCTGNLASSFTAEIIKSNLTHVLRTYYNKRWKNVANLSGDNASVCHRVAELARKPYDPCCNHLLSLELNRVVKSEQPIADTLSAVHEVVKEGLKQKVAAAIKKLTNLTSLLPGATRWSANVTMLHRFVQLREAKAFEKIPELMRLASNVDTKDKLELAREIFGIQHLYCLELQEDTCDNPQRRTCHGAGPSCRMQEPRSKRTAGKYGKATATTVSCRTIADTSRSTVISATNLRGTSTFLKAFTRFRREKSWI
jgi:hypothetical protein